MVKEPKKKSNVKKVAKKTTVEEVKVEKVEVEKKRLSTQTISTIVIGVLALVALIIGIIVTNGGFSEGNKESQEILDNFYKYMQSEDESVIYYGSSNCSYCELEDPIMKQIKEDYKMDYLYVDASKLSSDDNKEIVKVLDIEGSTPTIAVVKDDKVVDVSVGYVDGKTMVEFLKETKVLEEEAVYTPEQYLTFINYDKYKELVDKGEISVIVIGQTTCSHCISVKPVLSHVAGEYDVEINYLNLTEMNETEQSDLIESLKSLGYENADSLGTPLTIIVKDKKIESTIEGSNPPTYFVRAFKKAGLIEE